MISILNRRILAFLTCGCGTIRYCGSLEMDRGNCFPSGYLGSNPSNRVMAIEAIIFDWDGPLADSMHDVYHFQKGLCERLGKSFPLTSKEDLREHNLLLLPKYYEEVLGFDWEKDSPMIYHEYERYMRARCRNLYRGIPELLSVLDRMSLSKGIASNNTAHLIEHVLRHHNLHHHFEKDGKSMVIGIDHGLEMKPAPDMLLHCASLLGKDPKDCIYVGDSVTDICAAKAAGMQSIGVTWGFGKKEALQKENPDYLIDMPELIPLIVSGLY